MRDERNEICTRLYTISQDENVSEVYREWAKGAREYIYKNIKEHK